ncbi:MAG: AAA family ATPase [Thermoleophilia bacterium]
MCDLSGFTALTERLAERGRAGAEEVAAIVGAVLGALVGLALRQGGDVLTFGGDAIAVLFRGPGHELQACAALADMQRWVAGHGGVSSSVGPVRVRMSAGAESGTIDLVRAGRAHHALVSAGRAVSAAWELEHDARAGEVRVGAALAEGVPSAWTRDAGRGRTLRIARVEGVAPGRQAPSRQGMRWLAPPLARLVRRTPGVAELRRAPVGFVRAAGLDALAETDPHALRAEVATLAAHIEESCTAHGVTWVGADGTADGVACALACGVPDADEDDQGRLLSALREVVATTRGSGLRLTAGAASGPVFAGDLGHPLRRTFTLLGDAVNVAARLSSAAGPGELLATTRLLDESRRVFDVGEERWPIVEGKRAPVTARPVGAPQGLRRAEDTAPLVGRDRERAAIDRLLASAVAGAGGSLHISGASGLGKTHLLRSVLREEGRVRIGWCGGDPYLVSRSYAAIAGALRDLLHLAHVDDRGLAGALASRIEAMAPHLVEWLPLLADALDVAVPETTSTRRLDPEFREVRLHDVVIDALGSLDEPFAIVMDDAQWADTASRGLMTALARAARDRRWALITAGRPGSWSVASQAEGATEAVLGELAFDDARRVAIAAAGAAGIDDERLRRVVAQAAGHPFFLTQLVEAGAGSDGDVPEGVERLVAVRIDHLAPRDRLLLQEASVAGRTVDPALLAEVTGNPRYRDPAAWRALGTFVRLDASLVHFVHDLHRETAYARLPHSRRRALHLRFGECLLAREEGGGGAPGLLALHFSRGGDTARAQQFARRAASEAGRRGAWGEVAEMLDVAVRASANGRSPATPARVRMMLRRAEALELLGRPAEALSALPRPAPDDPSLRSKTETLRARLLQRTGRLPAALAATSRAMSSTAEDDGMMSEVLRRRASILVQQGRLREAAAAARAAVAAADSSARQGRALVTLGSALSTMGDESWREVVAEADRLLRGRHRVDRANNLLNAAATESLDGRPMEAQRLLARAAALFEKAGDSQGVAIARNNAAETLFDLGRLDEAEAALAEAHRTLAAAGDEYGIATVEILVGAIEAARGRLDDGERRISAARAVLAKLGVRELVLDADVRLTEIALMRRRADEGLRSAMSCERRARAMRATPLYGRWARRLRVWALISLGRIDEARTRLERLLSDARDANAHTEIVRCLVTLEAIAERTGETLPPEVAEERSRLVATLGLATTPAVPLA